MSEKTENTLTAYLGHEFQLRLMWQLLVEPEFAEKVIPDISVEYFDDPNLKRLFIIILEFFQDFEKVPNLQNQSIHHAINKYKPNNPLEEESLFSILKKIELWNQRVLNKDLFYDGDVVQKEIYEFIKQQEYRKVGEYILDKTRTGEIKQKTFIGSVEEKFQKIANIGDVEDYGTEITEGIENALRPEFRDTIPTGVVVLDNVTGGGLGKGEIGLILSPSGVGKTTLLTKIANTAYELEYNVLQIVFEDTVPQVQRKHYAIWTGYKLSEFDANNKDAKAKVYKKIEESKNKGRLVIRRFSQEDTTMTTIKNWILNYQKKHGYKFDMVVLDYLDCLEPHKRTPDRNEAELAIIKAFEAMAGDWNIPCWTAIQSNRSGFGADFVEAYQTGGSIKRLQKAHFFMSIAKTPEQQEAGLANIRILKARFAKDGQTFKDCVFDNDQMRISIKDDKYNQPIRGRKKYDDEDIDELSEKLRKTKKTMSDVITKIQEKAPDLPPPPLDNELSSILPIVETEKKNDTVENKDTENVVTESESFELDETENITEDDGVSDAVNDGVSDERKMENIETDKSTLEKITELDDKFTWTGETMNVKEGEEIEVTIKDIPKLSPTGNTAIGMSAMTATTTGTDSGPFGERAYDKLKKKTTVNVSEIESRFTDDEEVSDEQKHAFDYIVKLTKNQGDVKRE